MVRRSTLALTLAAALVLPLGAPLCADDGEPGRCCCEGAVCHKPATRQPPRPPPAEGVGGHCHSQAPQPADPVLARRDCPGGDPVAPVPPRDDHRTPALRYRSRPSLPPGPFVAAGGAHAPDPGFSQPPTPPPRRLV
jgi:hypothetical protein